MTILLFLFLNAFSQTKRRSVTNDLPKSTIYDFSKAVNYCWNYADNTDAFKGALIPRLQQRGIISQFDIERTIQDVGKSKKSRDLVLIALFDYTGYDKFNQVLLNMNLSLIDVKLIVSYTKKLTITHTEAALNQVKEESKESKYDSGEPYDESTVENFNGFIEKENKVVWHITEGWTFKPGYNFELLEKIPAPVKAILAYYASISSISYDFSIALGLGSRCSVNQTKRINFYFKNNSAIATAIDSCKDRAEDSEDPYNMERLEYAMSGNIISVSFAITGFHNNSSIGTVVGEDKFQLNNDNSITIIALTPKQVTK